jgi:protein-tyrosine-phosphatase
MLAAMIGVLGGLILAPALFAAEPKSEAKPSPMVAALWLAHQYGEPKSLLPAKDREFKIQLIAALAGSKGIPRAAFQGVLSESAFEKLAGNPQELSLDQARNLLEAKRIPAREAILAKTRLHLDLLTTQFDLIEPAHHKPAEELVNWIVKHSKPGKELDIIAVCTKNTRRSMLSATLGNLAASYYGLNVRFFSGGLDPDAINLRTIATLKAIGLAVEPTGQEAKRGAANTPNPIYNVSWGNGLATREFSKAYTDRQNPQADFAAIVVCSEADVACPKVAGASVRISVPYLDPKVYDDSAIESAKYAERRDDIGRFMLSAMMQARRRLEVEGLLK